MSNKQNQGHLIFRDLHKNFEKIVKGEGVYLFDEKSRRYFDACSGALVTSVGHGNKEIIKKVTEQLAKVAYVNGTQFVNEQALELGERLYKKAKSLGDFSSIFVSSGSEAVEMAAKIALQYWQCKGRKNKTRFISRMPSYHGNTLFALSLSGRVYYRKFFKSNLWDVSFVDAPSPLKDDVKDYKKEGGKFYADLFKREIKQYGADNIAAFIAEPFPGSSQGAVNPPSDYWSEIQDICERNEILFIADEVLCGVGRTGSFFACEKQNIHPDIIILGKGLGGGYIPISAVMIEKKIIQTIKKANQSLEHHQTYINIPVAAAAGNAVLEYMDKHDLVKNSENRGKELIESLKLKLSLEKFGLKMITGRGLLIGIHFDEARYSSGVCDRFKDFAMNEGLVVWPAKGVIDGEHGEAIVLAPPLTITKKEVIELSQLVFETLNKFKKQYI